jgi:cytidylate kinase
MREEYVTLCEYESVVGGNFNSWANKKENILFIDGLYKEGNSTLGKQIAKKYNAEYVNLAELEYEFAKHHAEIYMLDHATRTNILMNKVKYEYKGKQVVVEDIPLKPSTTVKESTSFEAIYRSIL